MRALLSWTYFLFTFWYQPIKLNETNLRVAGKSIDTAALKQHQFFTIYIFTYYINSSWTHCFCLIYCQSNYWLLSFFNTITFLDRWMKCRIVVKPLFKPMFLYYCSPLGRPTFTFYQHFWKVKFPCRVDPIFQQWKI